MLLLAGALLSARWLWLFYFVPALLIVGAVTIAEFIATTSTLLGVGSIFLFLVSHAISIWGLIELGCLRGTVGPNSPADAGAGATSPPALQTTATCVRFVTPNLRMICRT
jgi:uncharacterized membrane protein YhaH (DUF805 family)